jgi:hypothetical protein
MLGLSLARVYTLGRLGKIQPEAPNSWDVDKVAAALGRDLDRSIIHTESPSDDHVPVSPRQGSQAYESWRLTREKAARAELERQKLEGSLLDVREVRTAWAGMISIARSRLLLVGEQVSDTVAAEADPIRCREIITGSIHDALSSLCESR